jgi:hypothetical protein
MRFSEWKAWYRPLPVVFKIFIWLILLRPVIDGLYFLKQFNVLFSPPYLAGIIIFLLGIYTVIRFQKVYSSPVDQLFQIYFFIYSLSLIMLLVRFGLGMDTLKLVFKSLTPLIIFFIARRMVRDLRDVEGILQAFLYSACPVFLIMIYEVAFDPIKEVTTRTVERIEGIYADVLNYSIYLNLSMLIACYFMLKHQGSSQAGKYRRWLIAVTFLSLIGLSQMNHMASLIVFLSLCILFLFFLTRANILQSILFVLTGFFIMQFLVRDTMEANLQELIRTDVEVYAGQREWVQALHGRWGRWEYMWENFSAEPWLGQILGMPYTTEKITGQITGGVHNDFLRILFLTGFIGLVLYFFFLLVLFAQLKKLDFIRQFLLLGTISMMLLYSITTLPTLYFHLMNIIMPIYAMACLPEHVIKRDA